MTVSENDCHSRMSTLTTTDTERSHLFMLQSCQVKVFQNQDKNISIMQICFFIQFSNIIIRYFNEERNVLIDNSMQHRKVNKYFRFRSNKITTFKACKQGASCVWMYVLMTKCLLRKLIIKSVTEFGHFRG